MLAASIASFPSRLQIVIQRIFPRPVVDRCHRSSDHRFTGVVAEGHDVLLLLALPFLKRKRGLPVGI